jgi:hypothetical protein
MGVSISYIESQATTPMVLLGKQSWNCAALTCVIRIKSRVSDLALSSLPLVIIYLTPVSSSPERLML